ncbi:MAG: DUF4870 domain-containing protein [Bacteroidia bacterium]|nr:DUF4870 domain-containing protein [Bacteroidia bacterium]
MRSDRQLIVLTHLSQLVTFLIGFGSLLLPLILWFTNKDKVYEMDEHGKQILNFQISLILYALICIPLILLFGLGIIGLIGICVIAVIFPIIIAIKASHGESPKYPLSLSFIS